MEESKELQGVYKIFRTAIYVSLLIEFFMYAIDPEVLDYWNGVVCDVHSRIKSWFLYHDGHLAYSKIATFALICITCVGTRNKKHLEFNARKQVLYPLVCGIALLIIAVWLFNLTTDLLLYFLRLNIIHVKKIHIPEKRGKNIQSLANLESFVILFQPQHPESQ